MLLMTDQFVWTKNSKQKKKKLDVLSPIGTITTDWQWRGLQDASRSHHSWQEILLLWLQIIYSEYVI